MAHIGTFDASTVAPAEDFTPIPSGDYLARIVESDMKPTKSGTGEYLELKFEVIDGPHKGRFVWSRLNLVNPNPKAQEIAQRDLSSICMALDKKVITDSQELHYKPLVIAVDLVHADGDRRKNDGNDVRRYKRAEGVAQHSAPAATAAPAAQPANGAPAWARSAA